MLKRTTGRFLITALVITGLAGTVKNNALTKPERKYAADLMKDTYKDVVKATKGLSEAQVNFKPSAESWSVKEIVYHIAATENELWNMLEGVMKSPANPEKRTEIKASDEDVVKNVNDRSTKYKTSEKFDPKNIPYKSLDEALADFKSGRSALIKYIKTSTEDMRNHVVQMPVGWVDAYQFCLFIAAHSSRHTQQMEEVKASPGFPSK